MSFAIQTNYQIKPLQGQPGMLARVGELDYIDSGYVSTVQLQPGWGVILDPVTGSGYVLLPANTIADSHKLIGIVSVDQNTVGARLSGPSVPPGLNNLDSVIIQPGTSFNLGKQGYFYALVGQNVNKDDFACFDPVNKYWIKQTDTASTNLVTATFDESATAGSIGVIRLSGVVGQNLTV